MSRSAPKRLGSAKSRLCLGLSHQAVAVCNDQVNGVPTVWPVAEISPQAIAQRMGQLISQHLNSVPAGSVVQVLIGSDISHLFLVTPYAGIRAFAELQTLAALRFTQLYDEPSNGWAIQADWKADAPFLAVALPTEILNVLRQACSAAKLKLRTVLPYCLWQWNLHAKTLPASGSLSVFEPDHATQLIWQTQKIVSVRSFSTSGVEPVSTAYTVLAREKIRLNLPDLPAYATGLRMPSNATAASKEEDYFHWMNQNAVNAKSSIVVAASEPAAWLAQQGVFE